MEEIRIMGVLVTNRLSDATKAQEILTKYGCNIKTRLGLHETSENFCSRTGLLILELVGDKATWDALGTELDAIEGIKVKSMDFKYD